MANIIYSQSFISFLRNSDCSIAKLLFRLHCKNYNPISLSDSELNYITFRQDGTISYLPAGKECKYNDDNEWSREGRQNAKPSKVIRKILCDRLQKKFKDSDFECFTNSYKANYSNSGYTFELLPSDQIPDVYEMDRGEGEGSLNGSCMNGDSSYLDIYKCCEKLQILVFKNKEGLLCGRALVWQLSDTITFMDRIYVSQDFMYENFLGYAKSQNWWRKEHYKTYDYKSQFIDSEGNAISKKFVIYTDTDHSEYPYIDTFQYGEDGLLSNEDDYTYTYNCTGGEREGDNEEDDHDGETYDDLAYEWIRNDDAVYIENGERRYRGLTTHIDNCVVVGDEWYHENDSNIIEVGGKWYDKDDSDICEVDGEYHLLEDCTYSEYDNCYYLSEDCVYSECHQTDILTSDSVEVEGEYFHSDDEGEKFVEVEGDKYLIDSEEIEFKDGEWILKTEEEEEEEEINTIN